MCVQGFFSLGCTPTSNLEIVLGVVHVFRGSLLQVAVGLSGFSVSRLRWSGVLRLGSSVVGSVKLMSRAYRTIVVLSIP